MGATSEHGVTRRVFLGGLAALPLAVPLDGKTRTAAAPRRVAVVGAGAFGGWTALHLRRLGAEVVLVDAWGAGNARSSSGGESRVIRSIYGPDRVYAEMVKRSFELWREIDTSDDDPLYVETGALWMHRGNDDYVRSALPIVTELGFPVDELSVPEAKRRYPQIDLTGVRSLFLERRAGALLARRACVAVRNAFVKAGGTFRTAHAEPGAVADGALGGIRFTDGSRVEADAYVFACGPWLGRLFPAILGRAILPTRQEVYYFGVPQGSERYRPGRLPIWIDFGERIVYGTPDIDGLGFKLADDTRGEAFDPTNGDRTPSADAVASARRFLSERFPELAEAPLVEAQVCQYENSPDGHLIVDRHPDARNAWIVGGGSGHGFKLAPAVGEMVARAVVSGAALPSKFAFARLRTTEQRSTQFESDRRE